MNVWEPLSSYPSIGLSRQANAVRLELRRPLAMNAFDSPMAVQFHQSIQRVAEDETVRSVLITGSGRSFSAGADIGVFEAGQDVSSAIEAELRTVWAPTLMLIREMPKPVIAAVNGAAVGIGCSVALACDLILASESAYFLLAFSQVGLTPDGGTSLMVPARIGVGRAFVMALLGNRVPAAQAVAVGLADQLIAPEELEQSSEALAIRLAAGPTKAYAATKSAINRSMLSGLRDALDFETTLQAGLLKTADFVEGTAAFVEKRPSIFSGK